MSPAAEALVPAPCLRCGAAMEEESPRPLHGDMFVRCPFCGAREALPREAAERVRLLRLRLLQLRGAERAAEAPALFVKQALDPRPWLVALVFMGVVLAQQLAGRVEAWGAELTRAQAAGTLEGAVSFVVLVLPSLLPIAFGVGGVVGFLAMRRVFQRAVRPAMLARPASVPGAPLRCRSCGGGLPAASASQVACGYCGAANFLGEELTSRRAELLEAEAAEHRRRAQGWVKELGSPNAPARAFYVVGGLAAVGVAALMAASLVALVLAG